MKREIPARTETVCDRCKAVTIDSIELIQDYDEKRERGDGRWDLCLKCRDEFYEFMRQER